MLRDERSREEIRRLEDDFFDWFEAADAEELEDGTLDGFLEELERMDPLPGDFDPQKSLADFHEKYAALLEPQKEEKRQNHISRRVFFAVAAVAAVLASMVTAQAFGVDIFGFFGRWTDERFTFTSSADEAGYQEQDRSYFLEEGETAEFSSLEEALEAFQINLPLAPHWFPEGFGELKVTGTVMPYGMFIFANSEGREQYLMVEYSEFGENGPTVVVEKDGNETIVYETNGMQHYIVMDHDYCKAAWTIDNIQCVIAGPLTVEEMERIIDSIYSDGEKEAESPPPSSFASSLKAALDECGISGEFVPTWCPEGFEASEPVISSTKRYDTINVTFQDDKERFFGIMIICYQSMEDVELFTFEKDKTPVEQYTSGGKTFYIFSNDDTITAVWADGLIHESIAGNLTVEEFKKIIDSIDS